MERRWRGEQVGTSVLTRDEEFGISLTHLASLVEQVQCLHQDGTWGGARPGSVQMGGGGGERRGEGGGGGDLLCCPLWAPPLSLSLPPSLPRQVCMLVHEGREVIIVTSGAVGFGKMRLQIQTVMSQSVRLLPQPPDVPPE